MSRLRLALCTVRGPLCHVDGARSLVVVRECILLSKYRRELFAGKGKRNCKEDKMFLPYDLQVV